jgi:hypothetical protein
MPPVDPPGRVPAFVEHRVARLGAIMAVLRAAATT